MRLRRLMPVWTSVPCASMVRNIEVHMDSELKYAHTYRKVGIDVFLPSPFTFTVATCLDSVIDAETYLCVYAVAH